MQARRAILLLMVLVQTGCGCSGILDRAGQLEPDATDAGDLVDMHVDAPDAGDPLDADVPSDPGEEEGGCTSDDDCDDLEACNGVETCGEDGECLGGTPLADGMPCVSPSGIDGICNGEVCRPPGCGDGIPTGVEECDDANTVSGDGCENDCTYSCHAASDCDDSDVCTDDACIVGGTGRICDNPHNTASCNDSDPCTHTDTCDGAGTCRGTGYTCTPDVCESASDCDGAGGCTITYAGPGTSCNDLDPCTHTDVCDGAGACSGTGYTCTPGTCETASACDGSGGCTPTYAGPGASCNDTDPCTHTDVCDGAGGCAGTGYTCTPGTCEASSVCDGSGGCTVTPAGPGTSCNDTDPCTHTDVCDSMGGCAGTGYTCTPGECETASGCDGSGGCIPTYAGPGTSCNDTDPCTHTDVCDSVGGCAGTGYTCTPGECETASDCDGSGGCVPTYAGPGTSCNDTDPCTHTDVCDSVGGCAGTGYACTPGVCEDASDCDGSGGCVPTYSAPTTPCDDGYACTHPDECDGAGACVGTPDDAACAMGELCRPECFPSTGCGTPPTGLSLDCPDEAALPADALCTISLGGGLTGQTDCLACTTEAGNVVLSHDSFQDTGGSCSIGDWGLESASVCSDDVDACTPASLGQPCCDNAATITTSIGGDCRLITDLNTNCGGTREEWRLQRTYDLRGLADLEVCFNISGYRASDDEGMLLYARDSTHDEQVFCLNGPPVVEDGPASADWFEWPYCVDLPAWAEGNAAVVLEFIAHSENHNEALLLDDVVVKGWSSSCSRMRTVLFTEDFTPCPISGFFPDGWNGWSVTGSPACTTVCAGSLGGATAVNTSWSMSHAVDTSGVEGDVRLCFDAGDFNADWNEVMSVFFDAGSGWVEAWTWENDWGTDGSCGRVCVYLTDLDPGAARNPNLLIRFVLSSNQPGERIFIDDVLVDGASFCDGTGVVGAGPIAESGGGDYEFDLSSVALTPVAGYAVCSWDTPPAPIDDWDGTWFHYP